MTLAIFPDDTARTRRTDPLPSHVAGDTSQGTKKRVADAVMVIVRDWGPCNGEQINTYYALAPNRFGTAATDSPRKRAGELASDGLLEITNPDDPRGTPAIYRFPKEAS
jgi:hypothetical protein